jgi:hypothetical protein
MVLMRTVAEVEPGHVHAGVDKTAHALGAGGGGAEGTNDLGATGHGIRLRRDG